MTTTTPLVSAVITTQNRANVLPRALDSVLNQTYTNIEIVVVDDGSTDQTPSVIEAYQKEHPLLYVRNDIPEGACYARNRGISSASGYFVAGLDDDDEWHPERISILLDHYNDEYSCITSDIRKATVRRSVVWHKKEMLTLQDLLLSNQVGNQVLVRKDRLVEAGGFDETLEAAQDYDLWIRLCESYGPIMNVKKPLQTVYEDGGTERISTPKKQFRGYLDFYKKHKHKMDRTQRMYHLYNIRRVQEKVTGLAEMAGWVPRDRFWKELRRWMADKYLRSNPLAAY